MQRRDIRSHAISPNPDIVPIKPEALVAHGRADSFFAGELRQLREVVLQLVGSSASAMTPIKAVEVMTEINYKHSQFYNLLDKNHPAFDPSFPSSFPYGRSGSRRWWKHEVQSWVAAQDSRPRAGK